MRLAHTRLSLDSGQSSSRQLVLDKRERGRAELDRIALVHGRVVAVAAERVRRVAVRLDVGRERALEASRARRELNIGDVSSCK